MARTAPTMVASSPIARCRKPPTFALAYISPARSSKRRMSIIDSSHSRAASRSGSSRCSARSLSSCVTSAMIRTLAGRPLGMRTYSAASSASPEAAWPLLARPDRWPEWAPHLRGAWGLGSPEVREGALGAARVLGALPVPARIVAKRAGRSWTWRVGPVVMAHRVEPGGDGGCDVAIDLSAPGPLELALAAAYGPVIGATLRRLARRAEGR